MAINRQLAALNQAGQSIWYDNLSRDVLRSGELKSLIEQGVSGLTSNPTIFKKAIADTSDYDQEMKECVAAGLNTEEICEKLMLADVANAADLLRPVFEESAGKDGYASVEVSPFLAHDAEKTVENALRIWNSLDRPNIMIKVPATEAGLPAIGTLLQEGINVNVTLIFSVEMYAKVIETYLSALEDRASKGQSLQGITSVASFFVSRVDAICEKQIDNLLESGKASPEDKQKVYGEVGIANSKAAYELYLQQFGGERFNQLKTGGAKVQRPLWASTGTKNPEFDPLLYVWRLAGQDTVNTLPPAVLKTLLDAETGESGLQSGFEQAKQVIGAVSSLLPFSELLIELQVKGVKSFADSYQELLDSIEQKRQALNSAA